MNKALNWTKAEAEKVKSHDQWGKKKRRVINDLLCAAQVVNAVNDWTVYWGLQRVSKLLCSGISQNLTETSKSKVSRMPNQDSRLARRRHSPCWSSPSLARLLRVRSPNTGGFRVLPHSIQQLDIFRLRRSSDANNYIALLSYQRDRVTRSMEVYRNMQ